MKRIQIKKLEINQVYKLPKTIDFKPAPKINVKNRNQLDVKRSIE